MSGQGLLFDRLPLSAEIPGNWLAAAPPDLSNVIDVAIDLETTGLDWRAGHRPVGLAVQPRDGPSYYLPFGHAGGNLDESAVRRWCVDQLRGKRLWGANIKFDAHMFREWGVDLEALGCRLSDVQYRAAILDDHRRRFNLEELGQEFLGRGKVSGLDVTRMASYHASEVEAYARRDVELVTDLAAVFEPRIAAEDLGRVADLEDQVIYPVLEMERNGAPLDVERLEAWLREADAARVAALWAVRQETGLRVDPDRNADMVALFRHLGLEAPARTAATARHPEGQASFPGELLDRLGHPVIDKVQEAARLADLLCKFLRPYATRRRGDLLTFQLNQLRCDAGGTVSGRFSASDENIQQVLSVEKQRAKYGDRFLVRELFVPRSGLLLAADARQIQLRIFAHYSSERMIAAYARDPLTDYHAEVQKLLEPYVPGFPRKRLKVTNFTRLFGGGEGTIAAQTGMSRAETREFLAVYDRAYPEVREFTKRVQAVARDRKYVRTILGRRQRYPDCPRHGRGASFGIRCTTCPRLHKAPNDVIQGSEADIVKQKLVDLHARRRELGLVLRMVVHDEVVGDVPDAEAGRRVAKALDEQGVALKVPILWSAKTAANWADCA